MALIIHRGDALRTTRLLAALICALTPLHDSCGGAFRPSCVGAQGLMQVPTMVMTYPPMAVHTAHGRLEVAAATDQLLVMRRRLVIDKAQLKGYASCLL